MGPVSLEPCIFLSFPSKDFSLEKDLQGSAKNCDLYQESSPSQKPLLQENEHGHSKILELYPRGEKIINSYSVYTSSQGLSVSLDVKGERKRKE